VESIFTCERKFPDEEGTKVFADIHRHMPGDDRQRKFPDEEGTKSNAEL
jgi:hypothetical protein